MTELHVVDRRRFSRPRSLARRVWRTSLWSVAVLVGGVVLATGVGVATVKLGARGRISADPTKVGATGRHAAMVLGAGIKRDGTPTSLLAWRLDAAIKLYRDHRASVLIMSGDNHSVGYDEPMGMARYVEARGVPRTAVVVDYAGRRTYDSCWRARHVFGLDSVTVVTSHYHAPRAVFTCEQVGLHADALTSTERGINRVSREKWYVREWLADLRATGEYVLGAPHPVGGARINPFDPCSVWGAMDPHDRGAKPAGCA
jgi:vancomycin permeability regulator SanA